MNTIPGRTIYGIAFIPKLYKIIPVPPKLADQVNLGESCV